MSDFAAAFGSTTSNQPSFSLSTDSIGFLPNAEESILYTSIYKELDVDKNGVISAQSAVQFLSKSRLAQDVLNDVFNNQLDYEIDQFKIWNLSDYEKRGYLNQSSLFRALKLISAAQNSKPIINSSLTAKTPLPVFEGYVQEVAAPKMLSAQTTGGVFLASIPVQRTGNSNVSPMEMTEVERDRFKSAFLSINPKDGIVSADVSREFYLKSQLTSPILGRIWNLIDTKGTGNLNLNQFTAGMYLITRIKSGLLSAPPPSLPDFFWTMIYGKDSPLPLAYSSQSTNAINAINSVDKLQYEQYFEQLDTTRKGSIGGSECVTFFKKSNLSDSDLSNIWEQSDTLKAGVLNKDQFVNAMHLIKLKMASNPQSSIPAIQVQKPSSTSLLADLMDLSIPATTSKPTSSFNQPLSGFSASVTPNLNTNYSTSAFNSTSASQLPTNSNFSALSNMNSEKERDIMNRKIELASIQSNIKQSESQQEELISKRTVLDQELRTINDQKNQSTLKYAQIKATIEAEQSIAVELMNNLEKERLSLQNHKDELIFIEKALNDVKIESTARSTELNAAKAQSETIRVEINNVKSNGMTIRTQIDEYQRQYQVESTATKNAEQELQALQIEYQDLRKNSQIAEYKLGQEKSRAEESRIQIESQKKLNEAESMKLKSATDSIAALALKSANTSSPSDPKLERSFSTSSFASAHSNTVLDSTNKFMSSPLKKEIESFMVPSPAISDSSKLLGTPLSEIKKPVADESEFEHAFPSIENLSITFDAVPQVSQKPFIAPRSDSVKQPAKVIEQPIQQTDIDAEMNNIFGKNVTKTIVSGDPFSTFDSTNSGFGNSSFQFENSFTNTSGDFNFNQSFGSAIKKSDSSAFDFKTMNTTDPFAIKDNMNSSPKSVTFDDVFGKGLSTPLKVEETKQVQEMLKMGFDRMKVIDALSKCDNDVQKATDYLLK